MEDALNLPWLRSRGVTAIVNMAVGSCMLEKEGSCPSQENPPLFSREWYTRVMPCSDFEYLAVDARDSEDYPIWTAFDEVVSFISRCREAKRRVLVHCLMGVNRSATVVGAFLVRSSPGGAGGLGPDQAVELIRRKRLGTLTNTAFVRQLKERGAAGGPAAQLGLSSLCATRPVIARAPPAGVDSLEEQNRAAVG